MYYYIWLPFVVNDFYAVVDRFILNGLLGYVCIICMSLTMAERARIDVVEMLGLKSFDLQE